MNENKLLVSMTGYGRNETDFEQDRIVTEIRSVNHRFLEVMVRLPQSLMVLEEQVRKQVKKKVRRGRVDVHISIERPQAPRSLQFDWELLDDYLQISKQLQKKHGISSELSVADLLKQPELWHVVDENPDLGEVESRILQSVSLATDQLNQMRHLEGQALAEDLRCRCQTLQKHLITINAQVPHVIQAYHQKLSQRISDWIPASELDQDRLELEVALLIDKMDVTEECTRLASHIKQFESTLTVDDAVGKRLDFLIQEMHREMNTIGSKASDQTIRSTVVLCKSELEKMKEQVQNIE